jgi:hypothetical protein
LADGVVLDAEGHVLRYTIADRIKYLDALAKLTGAYAPVRTETKSVHVEVLADLSDAAALEFLDRQQRLLT